MIVLFTMLLLAQSHFSTYYAAFVYHFTTGLGSNTYLYLYLYLNMQISVFVFVFVFENPQDEIFVFVFVFDWRIWVYLTNIFQIHFSFLHFNT